MQALENVAVVFLGDPHYSSRFETIMQLFLRNHFHVDYLTFYKATLPQWLRGSPLVSYLYMDAAFLFTAPDNVLFWLVYPIQIIFDTIYTFLHITTLCKKNLRAIVAFSAPFRPGCVLGARMAAKYLRIPFWVDLSRDPHSSEYTKLRASMVRYLETRLLKSRYSKETLLIDSFHLVECFGLKRNYVLTLNTPISLDIKLQPPMHHVLLCKLRFAQPEQTSLGMRTLFHYAKVVRTAEDNYDHMHLEINSNRPAIILCPCNFRGMDDFEGIYKLAVVLERMLETYAIRTDKSERAKFTTAIIVVTGRTDPYVCPRTKMHHHGLKEIMENFNKHYTWEKGRLFLESLDKVNNVESCSGTNDINKVEEEHTDESGKAKKGGRKVTSEEKAKREAKLAQNKLLLKAALKGHAASSKNLCGAKHVRIAKCYLYKQDYYTLLDCADIVYISKKPEKLGSNIPAAMLDAILYEKIILRHYTMEPADDLADLIADATTEVTNPTVLSSNLVLALNQEEGRAKEAKEYREEQGTKILKARERVMENLYAKIFSETLLPQVIPPDMSIEEFKKLVHDRNEKLKKEEAEQRAAESKHQCSCGSGCGAH